MKHLFLIVYCLFSGYLFCQESIEFNVFFDYDKSSLNRKNTVSLDSIKLYKEKIKMIYIYGYTDFSGASDYNKELSQKRANTVKDYLLIYGFNKDIIKICEGKGVFENSNEKDANSLIDKGIREHRVVKIICDMSVPKPVKKEVPKKELVKQEAPKPTPKPTIDIEKVKVGENIVFKDILFVGGTPIFRDVAQQALQELFLLMQKNPNLEIEIEGHICCNTDDYEELSTKRAKAVFDFLVEHGIDKSRMTYVGYGATRKKYPNDQTEAEHAGNRRVEIKILTK